MTDALRRSPVLFLDFDGTISTPDATDAILTAHAEPAWLDIEHDWKAGRIGSRECLRAQIGLVRASPAQLDAVLDTISVDDGFAALLRTCALHAAAVHIVSDGFDYCIRRILASVSRDVERLLRGVHVFASHLEADGRGSWLVEFPFFREPCSHGCGTCKPAVMRALNVSGRPSVFVGDGLSDRYAVQIADVVFAKDDLATHCAENGIVHFRYTGLREVAAYLDRALKTEMLLPVRVQHASLRA